MASILLSAATAASSGSVVGAVAGTALRVAGQNLATQLFSKPSKRHIEGARLEDLAVQTSTYGRAIAQVFGTVRLAGNVIWSQPIREIATTTTVRSSAGKGGSRKRTQTVRQTNYSYSVTLAIAIGEGPIARIERVWADAKLLDLSLGDYRIYTGSETQLPDPLIESFQGIGNTPAYRGLAYVVIEDFPLTDFGNRIPNFSFEVTRPLVQRDAGDVPVEEKITSLILLPGSGEYVYDTVVQQKRDGVAEGAEWLPQGYRSIINQHTYQNKADALVAVDQMLETFPNLEWVGLVVNWFGTSMDSSACEIFPCVEYQTSTQVTPHAWGVAGYTRSTARLIGYDGGAPRYGGTPDDGSVIRLIDALRTRGLKIFFYPLLLMDVANKPWRGHLSGAHSGIANFFTRSNGYNRYILHYANLVAGKVDAFAIGSEMKALNAVSSSAGVYPAVNQFVALAASVKSILGSSVKVTYAADWSEYHHTDGGWYHLDPLWASPNIDMVGIDAYFPLTDIPQSEISRQKIIEGWTSGEGFDWYYTDAARTTKASLSAPYAWKNISWWWNNTHVNPNSTTTAWSPASKPIWFTEFGFASVDGTSNQPNVFVDPTSSENAYPRFSRKRVDFVAQREAIAATIAAWESSGMVARQFLWAFDARPYPAWPDLRDVWADGGNWATGHWVQGKLGSSDISALLTHVLTQIGLSDAQIDVSEIRGTLDGFILHQRQTARAIIEQLQLAYGFDVLEHDGMLKAIPRGGISIETIGANEVLRLHEETSGIRTVRMHEATLPKRVEVRYLDRLNDYNTQQQASSREVSDARDTETISLSLVLSENAAKMLADTRLHERWQARQTTEFALPMRYAALECGDVMVLDGARYKITSVQCGRPGLLQIKAVAEQPELFDHYLHPPARAATTSYAPLAQTMLELLDIPALPGDGASEGYVRVAMLGNSSNWPGAVLLREDIATSEPLPVGSGNIPATIGRAVSVLATGSVHVFDDVNTVEVLLQGEAELYHASRLAVLNGANAALLGSEVIQFTTATDLTGGRYRLSGLLRGRLGTEHAVASHVVGERFVLLNDAMSEITPNAEDVGRAITLSAVTYGMDDSAATTASITYHALARKPYAPVHVQAVRDGAGNLNITWVRRARVNAGWINGVDVPLDEAREAYRVQAWLSGTKLREWETTLPSLSYSASQQISDAGSLPSSLEIRVAQLSDRVGAGYEAVIMI